MLENISLDCGWGKLIFGKTFSSVDKLATELKKEKKKERNIVFNSPDAPVLLHKYSQDCFINPAYTYALDLENFTQRRSVRKVFFIRLAQSEEEIQQLNTIYEKLGMQKFRGNWWSEKKPDDVLVWVVVEKNKNPENSEKIIGGALTIDHFSAFKDNKKASSIWSLAIDPDVHIAGVGKSLMKFIIQYFKKKNRKTLFLSVIHSNIPAQNLYKMLGFERASIFTIKNKTLINQKFFISENFIQEFPQEIRKTIKEAITRGIQVENKFASFYKLSFGGRNITCNNTLTDQINSISASYCGNQKMFFHILEELEIPYPPTLFTARREKGIEFLKKQESIILKSQFHKLSSNEIKTKSELRRYGSRISAPSEEVILQKFISGKSYRILLIDYKVIAVINAIPPSIVGDGKSTVRKLIQRLSRKKTSMTEGQAKVPLGSSTKSCVAQAGYTFDSIPEKGKEIVVRKNSNFHTGGTMHKVTEEFPVELKKIAIKIAKKLKISVLDFEFLIPDLKKTSEYFVLGANPKPNFSYYQGHQVEQKFLDHLFPQTKR